MMTMKRLFAGRFSLFVWRHWASVFIVMVGAVFLLNNAQAELIALPLDGETEISSDEINGDQSGVKIAVTKRSLESILQAIQNISDIRFELAKNLAEESVTTAIESVDWSTAVVELLQPFNRVEIFNEDRSLKKVFVLRRAAERVSISSGKIKSTNEENNPPSVPPPPPVVSSADSDEDPDLPPIDVATPPAVDDLQPSVEHPPVTSFGAPPTEVPGPPPPSGHEAPSVK